MGSEKNVQKFRGLKLLSTPAFKGSEILYKTIIRGVKFCTSFEYGGAELFYFSKQCVLYRPDISASPSNWQTEEKNTPHTDTDTPTRQRCKYTLNLRCKFDFCDPNLTVDLFYLDIGLFPPEATENKGLKFFDGFGV